MSNVASRRARGPLWRPVATAAGVAVFIAVLGGTLTELGPWYQSLRQPSWKPPDALFGPAWTLIYGFTVAAAVIGWRRAPSKAAREWLLGLFALNGFLNVLWSLLFFRLHRPDWAAVEVVGLWLSIALLMMVLGRYARTASLLLTPYLAWVTLAGALTYAVARLNGPFA